MTRDVLERTFFYHRRSQEVCPSKINESQIQNKSRDRLT
jgi:hypothetical protein